MKKILLILILSNVSFLGYSQNIKIAGKLTDEKNTPLPYAHVSTQDMHIGTLSNEDGRFTLIIPESLKNENIIVKHLGYITETITIDPKQSFYNINLQPLNYPVGEVSVYPDDSVTRLVREAIRRIPENYLPVNSRQTGFYREYMQSEGKYLYFGEAIFDVFQPSYKNTEEGSVKILETRINRLDVLDSVSIPMRFYGGHTLHLRTDLVKQRNSFLNPRQLKSYIFQIDSVISGEENTYWKVGIRPAYRSNSNYSGYLLLDTESLTITEINFEYTQAGCDSRSKSLFPVFRSQGRQITLKYTGDRGNYYLKYMSDKEFLQRRNSSQKYIQLNEYVATKVDTINNNPIRYEEQSHEATIFSTSANDYNQTDWKDYTILDKDSTMTDMNLLEISGSESQEILSKRNKLNTKGKVKSTLTDLLVRSTFDITIGMKQLLSSQPIHIGYLPNANHLYAIDLPGISDEPLFLYGMMFGVRLTNKLELFYESEEQISSHHYSTSGLGVRYNLPLKNYGRKWLVTPSFKIELEEYGLNTGIMNSMGKFSTGGKTFDANKLSFSVGQSASNACLGFGVRKNISRQLSLKLSTEYTFMLHSTPRLFIAEKSGFWLTRKKSSVKINTGDQFFFDVQEFEAINHISLDRFEVKLGLEFGR